VDFYSISISFYHPVKSIEVTGVPENFIGGGTKWKKL